MKQTIKYARTRAHQDPDHGASDSTFNGAGVYSGSNMPSAHLLPLSARKRETVSRGAWARG
jgi:hypothetical protein